LNGTAPTVWFRLTRIVPWSIVRPQSQKRAARLVISVFAAAVIL